MVVCFSAWPYVKQKNGYGKWKDGYTFLNKNCLIVDAHLSLSKYRERKFTPLEISTTALKFSSSGTKAFFIKINRGFFTTAVNKDTFNHLL